LGKVVVDPTTPPFAKVRAAEAIITHGARAIELKTLRRVFPNWSGPRKRQNIIDRYETRSLAARLKRLEFSIPVGFQPPQIELCAVDKKGETF
jgi:hypothetical protein